MLGRHMHTAEPLVPEPKSFDSKIAIEELKRYKYPDVYHITAEMIQAEGIHKLINSVWNTEELPQQ